MIWCAICPRGISQIFVTEKKTTMNQEIYREDCLKKLLLPFIDKHYECRDQVLFWPDGASCHYAKSVTEFLKAEKINFVAKDDNPPNVPQLRPIEKFWAILKNKVYAKNWQAENEEQLVKRIKYCARNMDPNLCRNLLSGLKSKLRKAADNGVLSEL